METVVEDRPLWERFAAREGTQTGEFAGSAFARLYGPVAEPSALPFVIGQLGQSLDGRIATPSGHSHYVNGPAAITHLHRLRALVDAVVIGVGTALADDPRLTVRHVSGRNPARVVIDPNGRLPPGSALLREDGARRIVVGGGREPPAAGVERLDLPLRDGLLDPLAIVSALAGCGLSRVLVEGGGRTVSAFLAAGALTRLHVSVAPLVIGSGPCGLCLPAIDRLDSALRPAVSVYRFGDQDGQGDVLFDCAFAGR